MAHESQTSLSKAQLDLLALFNRDVAEQDWLEIKRLIRNYFAQKAMLEADQLWDQQGWSDQTMNDWLNSHKRTPYRQKPGE
ncbi:hypothetical protein [Fibrisoma limi]|uniref:hypothetical protein n=1 Tax=Fibrisoma limi TaxID=663275 RepID=UPI000587900B|nr:hypothetical protein [Fibrisoma limi]